MIIPIKRETGEQEWAIIELQGDIKFDDTGPIYDRYIGDLHFTKTGTPILIIGVHVLHGKEMTLPKPIAVLEKKHNDAEGTTANKDSNHMEYIIKAIIRKKLLFKGRPKPIVVRQSTTLK